MFWIIALGMATGMRTMTPLAVLCWFMWFGLLPVNEWTFWAANIVSVIVFTLCALSEYYIDTLPQTPSRTRLLPLLARLISAAVTGAVVASAYQEPLAGGIVFGCAGALVGAFGGYYLRMFFARRIGRDLPVAVCESALALGVAVLVLHFVHLDIRNPATACLSF